MISAARQRLAWWRPAFAPFAVAVLCVVAFVRFYPAVTSTAPLGDEMAQEKAFLEEAAGRSPYFEGSYVYPPSLLRLGAILRQLPLPSPYLPLRGASILGLAIVVWYSTGRLAWRPWQRLGAAVLYVGLAPGVRQGIEFGNLSFAVGGAILVGLLVWERTAVGSGLLLGTSLLLKPLAPAALVALFFHRPHRPIPGGQRHRLTVAVAAVAAALPLLADPEFGNFLRYGSDTWVVERTVSLHRFLALAGLPEGASILSLLLLAAVAAVARARVALREQLLAVALAGCVMVAPVVWNHTLVLTLPLQAMAVALATQRYRAAAAAGAAERRLRGWRGWEATGIALAVTALTFAEGATGIDDRGLALQIFATLPPALAPAILAAYVLRFHAANDPLPEHT